jgi:hypothetical protein
MSRIAHLIAVAAIASSLALSAAAPPISVDTKVRISMQLPAEFHVRISIEPHPANRQVCLRWKLYDFEQKGCFNAGAKTEWRWLKLRESGVWEVWATVERNDGTTQRSLPMRLTVKGPGYEEPPDLFEDPF